MSDSDRIPSPGAWTTRLPHDDQWGWFENWDESIHSCEHCQQLVIDTWVEPNDANVVFETNGVPHYVYSEPKFTLEQMRRFSSKCELFEWFISIWEVQRLQHPPDQSHFVWRYAVIADGTKVITFGLLDSNGETLLTAKSAINGQYMMMLATEDDRAADEINVRPVTDLPFSKPNLDQAREWMKGCHEDHEECPKPTESFVPSRLVAIEGDDLRIVDTKNVYRPYAALSYCWGGDHESKTTTSNIEQRYEGFRVDDLPNTLYDAMFVCRGIGIRYIWIDALCIVQDDARDAAREIGKMKLIYAEAAVTILASSAPGVHSGFLNRRRGMPHSNRNRFHPLYYPLIRLAYRCLDGQLGSVILLPLPGEVYVEPLDRRAWTLQERILSPRVLEYGTYQTRWNCSVAMRENGHVDGWTDREADYSRSLGLPLLYSLPATKTPWKINYDNVDEESAKISLDIWHSVVSAFSGRQLGFRKDRLPAISGITEKFADLVDDEYLAGMWKSILLYELLWDISLLAERSERSIPAIAPSWSWVGVNTAVNFPTIWTIRTLKFVLEIVSAEVQPRFVDAPFGEVVAWKLNVKGRIRSALWRPAAGFRCMRKFAGFGVFATEQLAENLDHLLDLLTLRTLEDRLLRAVMNNDAKEPDIYLPGETQIPVVLLEVQQGLEGDPRGLVLFDKGDLTYTRLGVFSFEWIDPFTGLDMFTCIPIRKELPVPPGYTEKEWESIRVEQLNWFSGCEPTIITIV